MGKSEIINENFKGSELIKGWEVTRIFPIFKEEIERKVKNYRGVALLDVGYNIVVNVLAKRLSN